MGMGEILLQRGVIDHHQLEQAVAHHQVQGGSLCHALCDLGLATEEAIATAMAAYYHLPFLPVNAYLVDDWVIHLVPREVAEQFLLIPLERLGPILTVAMADPSDLEARAALERVTQCEIKPFVSTLSDIQRAIKAHYVREGESDRRRAPRITHALSLTLTNAAQLLSTLTNDLSVFGVSCVVDRFLPLMTPVEIALMIPGKGRPILIRGLGKIVHADPLGDPEEPAPCYRIGIALDELTEQDRVVIAEYIEEVQAAA